MAEQIFYNNAKDALLNFFGVEFPTLPEEGLTKFISFFYKLCNYEEEGVKIRPHIILTNNINAVVKSVESTEKIAIHIDANFDRFNQRMKSLMCFTKNEWSIYVNIVPDKVEYGLVKTLNSVKDKNLLQQLFTPQIENLPVYQKVNLVSVDVISSSLVELIGFKGSNTSVYFGLNAEEISNWEDVIKSFSQAVVTKLRTTKRKLNDVTTLYENIFTRVFKNLHGAICLVVDKDFVDTKGMLQDGVWLSEPISLSKLFLQSTSYSESKLMSYADLLVDMLNYDGITVVDNSGRIRAYNVFIESDLKNIKRVVGGARRRAAQTLIESNNKKFVGVYLQSHDGDIFYYDMQKVKRGKKK